jgi:hypothetical protein
MACGNWIEGASCSVPYRGTYVRATIKRVDRQRHQLLVEIMPQSDPTKPPQFEVPIEVWIDAHSAR